MINPINLGTVPQATKRFNEIYAPQIELMQRQQNPMQNPAVTNKIAQYQMAAVRPVAVSKPNIYGPQALQQKAAQVATAQTLAQLQGGYTGKRTGNLGPSAYGYKGQTGLKSNKGAGPGGAQPQFYNALMAAQNAMKEAGVGAFGITDLFRSYEGQVSAKKRKGKLAATPGRSVHGLGLAADLKLSGKQLAWLKANGHKYGLVNLPSESWHWQLNPKLWKG